MSVDHSFAHAAFWPDFELHLGWVLLMGITMSTALYVLLRETWRRSRCTPA